jgi:SAM-dependent methyltransferase
MKKIDIDRDLILDIFRNLAGNLPDLLRTDTAKFLIGKSRLSQAGDKLSAVDSNRQCEGGLEHNLKGMENFSAVRRINRLPAALLAVDEIYERAAEKKLLIVGPRTEMEIFSFLSWGFKLELISALDLISYSDLVTQGDMHQMPWANDSFDVVVAGWVLAYSTSPEKAVSEFIRVLRSGGTLAIGLTRTANPPPGEWQPTIDQLTQALRSLEVDVQPLVSIENPIERGMGRTIFVAQILK